MLVLFCISCNTSRQPIGDFSANVQLIDLNDPFNTETTITIRALNSNGNYTHLDTTFIMTNEELYTIDTALRTLSQSKVFSEFSLTAISDSCIGIPRFTFVYNGILRTYHSPKSDSFPEPVLNFFVILWDIEEKHKKLIP